MPLLLKNKQVFNILFLVVLPAAFLYNLGLRPFIEDEAIRALVALEMIIRHDFITPTLAGDLYLKKPPLFNWIIAGGYQLSGVYNEWVPRLISLAALFAYSGTIYFFIRKREGHNWGLIQALLILSSGRILFYESMHGLIDISFSCLMFINFMVLFRVYRQQRPSSAYILSYVLLAAGFLLKGVPAILFQVINLACITWLRRSLKPLVHPAHAIGIFAFTALCAAYYLSYQQRNDILLGDLFAVLLKESGKRTGLEHGWLSTFTHLFTFPLESLLHFLPWSLLGLLFFHRVAFILINSSLFIRYCFLIMLANLVPYWLSPEVYPRYLLMFLPLYHICTLHIFKYVEQKESSRLQLFTLIVKFLPLPVCMLFFFGQFISGMSTALMITYLLSASLLLSSQLSNQHVLVRLVIVLLCSRLVFNAWILPERQKNDPYVTFRAEATRIGRLSAGKDLHTYWPDTASGERYYGRRICDYNALFYLTAARQALVKPATDFQPATWMLIEPGYVSKGLLRHMHWRKLDQLHWNEKYPDLQLIELN